MTVAATDVRPDVGALPSAEAIRARAGGENFAVASALLGRKTAHDLLTIYDYARLVDELGDAAPGDRPALLDLLEEEVDAAFGGAARHPIMCALAETIRAHGLPRGPFERLIDPETLVTVVRYIDPGSDFHRLARFLETHVNE